MTTYGPYVFAAENDADCQAFTFTSTDGQTTAGVIDSAGTAAKFCHDTDGTNSTNIGPQWGEDGNVSTPEGYLYTETSTPGATGDEYTMTFNTTLDASAEQWQFNFYSCQKGDDCDSTCEVQINESGGGWTTVATFGGSGDPAKLLTADDTAWTSRSVDLSNGGVNVDSSTQVRILITSAGATIWHGDYGIDTVEIVGTELIAREQEGYRFRENDGSETTATWAQDQDTPHTIAFELLGDEYPVDNYSSDQTLDNTLDGVYQSLTGQGESLSSVILLIEKVGTPAGDMGLEIFAHTGVYGTSSEPTGTAIATAVSINADNELDPHYHVVMFMFDGTVDLADGTNYVWRLNYTTGTATDYINVAVDNTTPTHGGNFGTYNGITYTPVSGTDAIFRVVEGNVQSRLRMLTDMVGDAPVEAATIFYREVGDPDSEFTAVLPINT